jgi:hypothetical protein
VLPVLDAYAVNSFIQQVAMDKLGYSAQALAKYQEVTQQANQLVRVAQREVLQVVETRDASIDVLNYPISLIQHLATQCRECNFPVGERCVAELRDIARRLGISEQRFQGPPFVIRRWRVLREYGEYFIVIFYDDLMNDPTEWDGHDWWLFFRLRPEARFVVPIMHAVQELAKDEPKMFSDRARLLFADFF